MLLRCVAIGLEEGVSHVMEGIRLVFNHLYLSLQDNFQKAFECNGTEKAKELGGAS